MDTIENRAARTLEEEHELALELLPSDPLTLLESAARVDLVRIRTGDSDSADRAAMNNENGLSLLVFAQHSADVLLAAYICDAAGRVQSWKSRFEITGPNWPVALEKLRFALVNELIEAWKL